MAHRRIGLLLATLTLLGLSVAPARAQHGASPTDPQPLFDASAGAAPVAPAPQVRAAAKRLRQQLGPETLVDVDPKTGTPREIVSLDGFLSGPHPGQPEEIARHWIDDNAALLGLDHDDTRPLREVGESTSPAGITDVTFAQTYAGLRAFNAFIRVSVAPGGRVLNVTGSPTPDLHPDTTKPLIMAADARARAKADAGANTTVGDAELVLFAMPQGARLAWYLTSVPAPTGDYVYLVDASDGRILWRQNTTDHTTGLAWDYYPSTLVQGGSGVQQTRDFTAVGWLSSTTTLSGPNVRTYADLNDNNRADSGEQIPPTSGNWNYSAACVTRASPLLCNTEAPCVWHPFVATSWTTNERQNATQLFYFVNTFHDWLSGDPFGFTAASGNFETDDPVE